MGIGPSYSTVIWTLCTNESAHSVSQSHPWTNAALLGGSRPCCISRPEVRNRIWSRSQYLCSIYSDEQLLGLFSLLSVLLLVRIVLYVYITVYSNIRSSV